MLRSPLKNRDSVKPIPRRLAPAISLSSRTSDRHRISGVFMTRRNRCRLLTWLWKRLTRYNQRRHLLTANRRLIGPNPVRSFHANVRAFSRPRTAHHLSRGIIGLELGGILQIEMYFIEVSNLKKSTNALRQVPLNHQLTMPEREDSGQAAHRLRKRKPRPKRKPWGGGGWGCLGF